MKYTYDKAEIQAAARRYELKEKLKFWGVIAAFIGVPLALMAVQAYVELQVTGDPRCLFVQCVVVK